jgi:hypothetical protein
MAVAFHAGVVITIVIMDAQKNKGSEINIYANVAGMINIGNRLKGPITTQ